MDTMSLSELGRPDPTVLLVEDHVALAGLYESWLADDCEVRVAHDCETAYDALDDAVEVALLDRQLPDGSGDEVLNEIRARELDCRVSMVSAIDADQDVDGLDFDTYLQKPITRGELRETVERLLAGSPSAEGADPADDAASNVS